MGMDHGVDMGGDTPASPWEIECTFEDVWGSGPNDVYVVGDMNGVAHSTGDGVWTIDPDVHNQPLGIWGFGPSDVCVVGDNIAHKKI